jgi:hypothetical protein
MTTFRVLEPDEWGMRWARPPIRERLADPETYVHHTAGNPGHTLDAAVAFRNLNEYAINTKGYSAVDYDILVHENTVTDTVTVGVARGQWLSAATKDRNEDGEAVCALGYFTPGHSLSEHPSPGMLEGVARAIILSIERGWSAPDTKILGHRDNPAHPGATGCPGDWLYEMLPSIRKRVSELLDPLPDPPQEDPMYARGVAVRPKGYADQLWCQSIANPEHHAKLGITEAAVEVALTAAEIVKLELELGYKFTKLT